MLVALHRTLANFLSNAAPRGSLLANASKDFSVPDAEFRGGLSNLTLNLYLHELRENLELRRAGGMLQRSADGARASRLRGPALLDCGYCITAWSMSTREANPVFEEHGLLIQAFTLFMKHQTIPESYWEEGLRGQLPPYPMVVAQPEVFKNQAEFWSALGHPPKPILTYVVTIAVPLHDSGELGYAVGEDSVRIEVDNNRPGAS